MELAGRTAVVTGGASGIGADTARALVTAGCRVVTWDVSPGADVQVDVSDAVAVDRAVETTVAEAGVPTICIAAAGIGHSGMLLDVGADEWDRVLGVNLRGAWLSMRAVARTMRDTGESGAVVAVTSVSARLADRGMGAYCTSKAGLEMVVKVAACEWAELGIRVNGVGPGVTRTPMLGRAPDVGGYDPVIGRTPLRRLGEAEDVTAAILALLTLDWVTGQIVLADGGLSLHSPIDPFGPR